MKIVTLTQVYVRSIEILRFGAEIKTNLSFEWRRIYLYCSFFAGGGHPLAVWAEFEAVDLLAVALVREDAT